MSNHVFFSHKNGLKCKLCEKNEKNVKKRKKTQNTRIFGTFVYVTFIFIYKENEALTSSTPQYKIIPHRPLKTGYNHNIH